MTTIEISLPPAQLELLTRIEQQQQAILFQQNETSWLTDDMVAQRFHVSVSTVRRWRDDYSMPFRKVGDVRLYVPKEVDEWMNKFSEDSPQEALKLIKKRKETPLKLRVSA